MLEFCFIAAGNRYFVKCPSGACIILSISERWRPKLLPSDASTYLCYRAECSWRGASGSRLQISWHMLRHTIALKGDLRQNSQATSPCGAPLIAITYFEVLGFFVQVRGMGTNLRPFTGHCYKRYSRRPELTEGVEELGRDGDWVVILSSRGAQRRSTTETYGTTSSTLRRTTSQARDLLLIARLNSARSRRRLAILPIRSECPSLLMGYG